MLNIWFVCFAIKLAYLDSTNSVVYKKIYIIS